MSVHGVGTDWAWGWARVLALTPAMCGTLALCPQSPRPRQEEFPLQGREGAKGMGLKDEHKAWCTSGSVRPGWRGSG